MSTKPPKITREWLKENSPFHYVRQVPKPMRLVLGETPLSEYLENVFPEWEPIGPVRKEGDHIGPEEYNRVFLEGDLLDNGLTDVVAILRSRFHEDEAIAVSFFQTKAGVYHHHRIPIWVSQGITFLQPFSIKQMRQWWNSMMKGEKNFHVSDETLPDNRFAVLIGILGETTRWVHFVSSKKGPCTLKFGC